MNAWVRKSGNLLEKYRVTASGARNMVIFSGSAPTVQTSHDGVTWIAATFATKGAGRYVHSVEANGELLGSFFRVSAGPATYFYFMED